MQGRRILIADDDEGNREVFRAALEMEGCSIVEACDGAEALDELRDRGPFDAAVVDLMMPNVDGVELVATMRGSERFADVGLVVCSGFAAPPRLDQFNVEFVRKPCTTSDLLRAVRASIAARNTLAARKGAA